MNPLPFEAEPLESLRARYPLAVAELVDVDEVEADPSSQPSGLRRHVFDFDDGLRLVVGREIMAGIGEYLHLSASLDEESKLYGDFAFGPLDRLGFAKLARMRFRAISGDVESLGPVRFTGEGVAHWCRLLGGPERFSAEGIAKWTQLSDGEEGPC